MDFNNIPGWGQMTPLERMQYAALALQNPCNEEEHDYELAVNDLGKSTALQQICRKCFTMQGWIYDWHTGE